MSDLIKETQLSDSHDCPAFSPQPIREKIPTHNAELGKGLTIRRALPQRARRMIGAWCFFDHFGPLDLQKGGLNIPPHPHMGLQTFTWTIAGEILHRDSLGSEQIIRPGAVNLMTAGKGISHSEESLPDSMLHGVQLWIALPDAVRNNPPAFAHHAYLPTHEHDGVRVTVLVGELFGLQAPTQVYSPLIGLDLHGLQQANTQLPMNPKFEYGVLVLSGSVIVEGEALVSGELLYLGCGRQHLDLTLPADARVFMIGGQPFEEEILLWWNFVGRSRDEMVQATEDWQQQRSRFGVVQGYGDGRLDAPSVLAIKK
jgi:redox-sensitive bicupin YhaK (pirin superfamily)